MKEEKNVLIRDFVCQRCGIFRLIDCIDQILISDLKAGKAKAKTVLRCPYCGGKEIMKKEGYLGVLLEQN